MTLPTEPPQVKEHRRAINTAIATIAMLLGVKLAPGHAWRIAYKKRTVVYPLRELIEGTFQHGAMRLWQIAAHVLVSHGKLNLYDVLVDTTLDIALEVGRRTTRPDWLMPLVAAAERERAEHFARKRGRSLAQRQLPPRGTNFRADDRKNDLEAIARPIENEAGFWEVAGAAVLGLVSRTLTLDDLAMVPLPWTADMIDALRATNAAPSYDALIESMQPIVIEIAIKRAEEIGEPEPDPENGEESNEPTEDNSSKKGSDETDGSGASGNETGQSSTSTSTTNPPDNTEGTAQSSDEAAGPKEKNGANNGRKPIIFSEETGSRIDAEVNNDPGRADVEYAGEIIVVIPGGVPDLETDKDLAEILVQLAGNDLTWNAVSRSNEHVTRPIERVISEYLTENEIGDIERGTRSGMLDVRQIIQPDSSTTPPFRRRAMPDDRSYDVALVVDRSGSMMSETESTEDASTFGVVNGRRWHLACRMVVGLVESLQHMPDTRTAVVLYDHEVETLKKFEQILSDSLKDEIIQKTVARGGNDDSAALAAAISQFADSQAERKMIVYLTDGEFCSNESSVRRVLARCAANDIELVFLTVGQSTQHITRFVPAHLADEITPETISTVLSKHITRMLAGLAYA